MAVAGLGFDEIDFVGAPGKVPHGATAPVRTLVAAVFSALQLIGATSKGFAPRAAGLYAGASVLAFLLYWMDKRAALTDAWRTPEKHPPPVRAGGRLASRWSPSRWLRQLGDARNPSARCSG